MRTARHRCLGDINDDVAGILFRSRYRCLRAKCEHHAANEDELAQCHRGTHCQSEKNVMRVACCTVLGDIGAAGCGSLKCKPVALIAMDQPSICSSSLPLVSYTYLSTKNTEMKAAMV